MIVRSATRTARRAILLAIVTCTIVIGAMALQFLAFDRAWNHAVERGAEIDRLAATILLEDERLTASALLAAATLDRTWVERYRARLPVIYEAIERAAAMASRQSAERFRRETAAANDRLVELETQAFELVDQGRGEAARAILQSDAYAQQKAVLASGTDALLASLDLEATATAERLQRDLTLNLSVLVAASVAALLLLRIRVHRRLDDADRAHDAAEERVTALATHDVLTGLPNRRYLGDAMRQAFARTDRARSTLALLVLDLDHFKGVNDRLGHSAGDAVLVEAARRIAVQVRAGDTLARIGGDEFVALVEVDRAEAAEEIAARIVADIARPIDLGGASATVGISIGIAMYPTDATSGEDLFRKADTALYRAKESGRSGLRRFDRSMAEAAERRASAEADLRRAVDADEIVPFFQPVVELRTGRLQCFEVLARWRHPEQGMIPPDRFLPVAAETGLVSQLGLNVLRQACRIAAAWDRSVGLAINLSSRELADAAMPERLLATLAEVDVAPTRLAVEVTETALLDDLAGSSRALRRLRAAGVRVLLDDFGKGYSSLSRLVELPLDGFKIDPDLVAGVTDDARRIDMLRAVVALGESLGLATYAERIEDRLAEASVRSAGCHFAQGFHFGRPMDGQATLDLMRRGAVEEPAPLAGLPTPEHAAG